MIIVADTSPINDLVLLKEIEILPKIYGRVVIPKAVREELLQPAAPEVVRTWVAHAPEWLEIRTPVGAADPALENLDPGERDAILLAAELHADRLTVDDRAGRKLAEQRGIPVMGTLGVLKESIRAWIARSARGYSTSPIDELPRFA